MKVSILVTAALVCLAAASAQGSLRITEWMYNGVSAGNIGEFVELTNVSGAPIDMNGWSFDDDSRMAGTISLSAFGIVAPRESVVLTDEAAEVFRTAWGLSPTVKIIGGSTANLGRSDEINIFDSTSTLADRLTYSDQNIAGTIRTNGVSGNPASNAALGVNSVALWNLSVAGDAFGSRLSANGDLGNPGSYPVPEPASAVLVIAGAALALRRIRR